MWFGGISMSVLNKELFKLAGEYWDTLDPEEDEYGLSEKDEWATAFGWFLVWAGEDFMDWLGEERLAVLLAETEAEEEKAHKREGQRLAKMQEEWDEVGELMKNNSTGRN